PLETGTLLMDGIVVDGSMRGQGIGSRLLDAILDYARMHDYEKVRLDVVDTNPRARALYERKGFVEVRTERYPILKPIFGFAGSATMLRTIAGGNTD
ncbi:MAG: GNAT family N-acetyltransferase, partial [Chloroflexi bacterium]|nr:GNAT family N-acetyltransferase [Chloroflexota bacterium]